MSNTALNNFWQNKTPSSPFINIFSALWHYHEPLPSQELTHHKDPTASSPSSSPTKQRSNSLSNLSSNADYDSHRLAVQYAIGCTSKYDCITYNDLKLFIERFGPLTGTPPTCILRARASLIIDRNNEYELAPWYHGDISRTQAQQALTQSVSQGGTTRYLIRWSRSKSSHFVLSMASNALFSMNDDDEDQDEDQEEKEEEKEKKWTIAKDENDKQPNDNDKTNNENETTMTPTPVFLDPPSRKKRKKNIKNYSIKCLSSGEGYILNNKTTKVYSDLLQLLSDLGMVAPFFQPCSSLLWTIIDPEHATDTLLMRLPLSYPSNALETEYLGPTPAVDDAQLRAGIKAFEWDIDEAVILFEDVYRRNRSATDLRDILSCARSLGNLGNAQQKKGKGEVAVRYFEECLQLLRQLLIGRVGVEEVKSRMNGVRKDGGSTGSHGRNGQNQNESNDEDDTSSNESMGYYDGDVRISKSDYQLMKLMKKNDIKTKSIIKLKDLIKKEANIVANLCVVTAHILQITPGEILTDERKAQIAVQFASCLGEELGITGNRTKKDDDDIADQMSTAFAKSAAVTTDTATGYITGNRQKTDDNTAASNTRTRTLERHTKLLKSTGIQLSWVSGLASKLLEDGYQMKEDGKVLSAAHMFFQCVCISRLTDQPTLEALALESLAGIEDIPIVIFLRIWSTCGQDYWSNGISPEGIFTTPVGTFRCKHAGSLASKMMQLESHNSTISHTRNSHTRHLTASIMRATSPQRSSSNTCRSGTGGTTPTTTTPVIAVDLSQ